MIVLMRFPSFILALFVTAFVAIAFCDSASACPTCKDSLHSNGVATGYAISILFMMGMPFLIAIFWAVVIFRLRKKMRVAQLS